MERAPRVGQQPRTAGAIHDDAFRLAGPVPGPLAAVARRVGHGDRGVETNPPPKGAIKPRLASGTATCTS